MVEEGILKNWEMGDGKEGRRERPAKAGNDDASRSKEEGGGGHEKGRQTVGACKDLEAARRQRSGTRVGVQLYEGCRLQGAEGTRAKRVEDKGQGRNLNGKGGWPIILSILLAMLVHS